MADIRFYHMEQSTLDSALPMIVTKAWESGARIMVRVPDMREANRINDLLWNFRGDAFIPHGMDGDKDSEKHPVFVTANDDNPNNATILILTQGCTNPNIADFKMVCEMLDGRVPSQISDARTRWKSYKDDGHDLTYWQQDENGKWGKKA